MIRLIPLFLFLPLFVFAQKKPLDHTVYDGWQSTGERLISHDGRWVVYTITPQEGDAVLMIHDMTAGGKITSIPRGYNALITEDSRFVVMKIKPPFQESRDARIKKKKPEDFPKDSIAVVRLQTGELWKQARVRSFKTPRDAAGWVAYHKEKPVSARPAAQPTQKTVDSLRRTIDSLVLLVAEIKNVKGGNRDGDADEDPLAGSNAMEGSDLVLRSLEDRVEFTFPHVSDYYFNDRGQVLLMKIVRKDSVAFQGVVLFDLHAIRADTIARGGNDFRNFALSEDGSKVAFVAERDTAKKAPQKFYGLYLYRQAEDSASLFIDKHTSGMQLGMTISENGPVSFSKSGNRLLFGTIPIPLPRDTSVAEIDQVKLDVWHYKDDYLQTQQLFQLNNELKRSYQAVYDFGANKVQQLGSRELQNVLVTDEGDGPIFYAVTDTGRRIAAQWSGSTLKDIYAIDLRTGQTVLVKKNHNGTFYPSSTGKYILLYDNKARHYFTWNGNLLQNISSKIRFPLYDEEYDMPNEPNAYGFMGWHEKDSFVYVYDRYGVWKLDPENRQPPTQLISGREGKNAYRYVRVDPEEKAISANKTLFFRMQNERSKGSHIFFLTPSGKKARWMTPFSDFSYTVFLKAKASNAFLYTQENYETSPNLFYASLADKDFESSGSGDFSQQQLTNLNPQQAAYNWGTAELFRWKTFNGKESAGILYKPEDFDPAGKYPVLIYFYEKLTDGLHTYIPPAPTPSRLNIPFFVSRGYLVFAPDISYTKGQPGKDAYNYIVSGAQALAKNPWVDAKNIGIQGQSWGGYQVTYLVTRTNMFKAAWAGAPVANMTSAYGGIRWESGNNRQFQYEKGQSRIGATIWERPDLYMESSPLFHLPKVTTPLVIMANDADGAVPWCQGIELFTAMRRLGKPVWMLNYNGEAHNLVERKNRKDIQIREQQYFDWLLKGAAPAKWITEGIPAVKKGKTWGLDEE
jgi:dipeptidyl aminopeptidase/acylaminoacyl peptidase